jgi:flavoprotein
MNKLLSLTSFLSKQSSLTVIWCYTGAGHCFKENFEQIIKLNQDCIPICLIFSEAGALVANRYGFFWRLCQSDLKKDTIHFMFPNKDILNSNIEILLNRANLSYGILSQDPAYSIAISLAYNRGVACIIGSPFTANTIAKLASGIADSFISNLISHGVKAGSNIGIFPTDASTIEVTSFLPVRYCGKSSSEQIEIGICQYNAIKGINPLEIDFLANMCVGCKKCVMKYPELFTYGEQIKVKIRNIDVQNVNHLRSEVVIFSSPKEIEKFVKRKIKSKSKL